MNTVITLKRETSKSYQDALTNQTSSYKPVSGMLGFLLKVSVEINHNIDKNIFVIRRDLDSQYSQDPIDVFYSVASVGELEHLPIDAPAADSTNFFRTDSIELMFESPKDLENAWAKISSEVFSLAEDNDASINTSADVFASYPNDAINLFFGTTTKAVPGESDILSLGAEKSDYFKTYVVNNQGASNYFVFCYPSLFPQSNIYINGVLKNCNYSLIDITSKYGLQIEHRLYITSSTLANGILNIELRKI
jgi:hypothetical protein